MKNSFIVAKKELLEIIRDRTTIMILLMPVFIFPLFNAGMGFINKDVASEIRICVERDDEQIYKMFSHFISETEGLDINYVETDVPNDLLRNGEIDCFIQIKENDINFIYNSASYNSISLTTKLGEGFQRFYYDLLGEIYEAVYQFNLIDENNNVSNVSESVSNIFVPVALVMLVFQSVSSFSNDLFAGEKERKTLEMLLLSSINRKSIYLGKSIALLFVAVINLAVSLGTYLVCYSFAEGGIQQLKFSENGIAWVNLLVIIIMLVVLSLLAVFISLNVSMFSKSLKISQITNEIVLAIPVGMTALISLGLINKRLEVFDFIPMLNAIVGFNDAFRGVVNYDNLLLVVLTNGLLVGFLIFLSTRYMNTEKIMK